MSGWTDFQRSEREPWSWWVARHEVKLFLVALALVIIF